MNRATRLNSIMLSPRRSRLSALLLTATCITIASHTKAQSATDLIANLNAPSYESRAQATATLLADHDLTDQQIIELMRQATTPEQRHRLMGVAHHHVLRRLGQAEFPEDEAGALGVSSEPVGEEEVRQGITAGARRVILTLPGFPGHEMLQHGDIITAINDRPLPPRIDDNSFPAAIQRHPAGTTLTLTIIRQGQTQEVELTLVSSRALVVMYPPGPNTRLSFPYARAWQEAREKFEQALPDVPMLELVQ